MSPNYLYGLHDPGGERIMEEAGKPGWLLFTEALGTNPQDHSGHDYGSWANRGLGVIARLNNGYGSAGTIPHPAAYGDFARRCANFVAASPGCKRWIIGNEPNHEQEWPDNQVIHAHHYVECFQRCRQAIKGVQPDAEVLLAAIAPWNVSAGDWIRYFQELVNALEGQFDGFALHTYTHGSDAGLVTSEATMNPPFQDRRFHFRAYQDFLKQVPSSARHLPVYITEADQNEPWAHANMGWVQAAYAEINRWNQTAGTQKIHCLCLYRWPNADRWVIEGNDGVISDFRAAIANDYQLMPEARGTTPRGSRARRRGQAQSSAPGQSEANADGNMVDRDDLDGREWDPRLTQRGVRVEEFMAQPGQSTWRLVKAEYLDEQQSQGRHHILVDTLDERGERLVGVTIEFSWGAGQNFKLTDARPNETAAVDFPIYASGFGHSVRVTGDASDKVSGMGLGTIEQPNIGIHVSYRLVFQRTTSQAKKARGRRAAAAQPALPQPDDNWKRTLAFILEQEGGWSDDPDDPDGATMKGITLSTYTLWRQALSLAAPSKAELQAIADAEVERIYRQWYWTPSGANGQAWPLCLLVMDTAVLHGINTAKAWLSEVGPNPYQFAFKRLQIYTGSNLWRKYGAGWVNRLSNLLKAISTLPPISAGGQPGQPDANLKRTLLFVLQYEGGWSDHPSDPGGATMKGITIGTYTSWRQKHGRPAPSKQDLRNIPDAEVEQIYRENYWFPSGANDLPWPLCLIVMDTAVLHGVGAALTWINEVGPNPYLFAAKRLRVYTKSDNWGVFGAGWVNRVAGLLRTMS